MIKNGFFFKTSLLRFIRKFENNEDFLSFFVFSIALSAQYNFDKLQQRMRLFLEDALLDRSFFCCLFEDNSNKKLIKNH